MFEQVANWCLAVALVALGLLAVVLHQVAGFADLLSSGLATVLLLAGSLLAAATQIWYLGTLAPVLDARSIPGVDHGALATMTESARRADDYLENLGLLLIAAGLLCLTRLASARSGWPRDWQALSSALAVGVLVVVATSFAGSELNDWALLAVGLVLAPLWAARLGLLLSRRVPPEPD